MEIAKRVFDKYFDFLNEFSLNLFHDELIPKSMLDMSIKSEIDGLAAWKAINSTITQEEILKLENFYKNKLPESYKDFLRHRHFVELNLGSDSIDFFKSLPNTFLQDTIEEINNLYFDLVGRNYLPFASLSDWGVLCFDANEKRNNFEYPVVQFDHEDGYERPEAYASNFESLFQELEVNLNDWVKAKRKS